MMVELEIFERSDFDTNLFREYLKQKSSSSFVDYIRSLPLVADATWGIDERFLLIRTIVYFESEAHKSWFLLRWS